MKQLIFVCMIIALGTSALAQKEPMKFTRTTPDELIWMPSPPAIPKGAQMAVITGDPTKAGSVVVQRVKFPPNYIVPPHTHPYDEIVTIISGPVVFGMGEKVDPSSAADMPGTVYANPAKNPHYVKNGAGESIIQTQFVAPGGIDYINPSDDPRK